MKRVGRKSKVQTPAPKKDRIKGKMPTTKKVKSPKSENKSKKKVKK